jgi:hypothetical protein
MKALLFTSALAGVAALSAGAAAAQDYDYGARSTYEQQQRAYQASREAYRDRVENYQERLDDYRARQDAYREQQEDYVDQQAAIDAQRDAYFRARDAYDARWGIGAYDRTRPPGYIPRPADLGPPVYAPVRAPAYRDTCRERGNRDAAARGYITATASSAIGADAARRSTREGPVLGALVDVRAHDRLNRSVAMCDGAGYFYSFDQTFPYRETAVDMARGSGRYDYDRYVDMRCRLAIAPARWGNLTDYRYIRVCPDARGRYRITS